MIPRIEDELDKIGPVYRSLLLRDLIIAERDWKQANGLLVDPLEYLERFPDEGRLIDELLGRTEPGSTVSQRDRAEIEVCLLFGFLCLANGLTSAETLTRALDVWTVEKARTLREILVDQGDLIESDALIIETLASIHLEQHQGVAWESLVALGKSVWFRIDPDQVADSELRGVLAGFVDAARPERGRGGGADIDSRYEIIKRHAKGGLGVVNLARDREIHREVALKEIREDCADHPDYRARFLREAEVTGRLEHPGIVPVYGIGHHPGGRPYYIMRFIRGETLKVAIGRLHKPEGIPETGGSADGPTLHTLVGRFIDACHAVSYAHHRKILHRDLKPINIMLGPFGETLVVDWGLAKSYDESGVSESSFDDDSESLRPESGLDMTPTRIGSKVGTAGYMSPEQAAGRLHDLGPTSDIYSLGATLYFLATGHPPFEGADRETFYQRVVEGDFARPSAVNPAIPRALEAICLKAMALRPVDRYPTVVDLIEDLERWRAGEPVLAYPEPMLDRLIRWGRSHQTALTGAAAILVCLTIGLGVFAEWKREENRTLAAANTAIRTARDQVQADLKLTRGSLRMSLDRLAGPDLAYLPNSGPPRLDLAESVLGLYRDLIQKHPNDHDVKAELAHACRITANIGRSLGQFEPPRSLYVEAIGWLEPLVTASPEAIETRLELAWSRIDLGEHLRMAGRPRLAEAEQNQALQILASPSAGPAIDSIHQAKGVALINLAASLLETGRPVEALRRLQESVEFIQPLADVVQSSMTNRMFLIYALTSRASAMAATGDGDGSRKDLDEALRRARELVALASNADSCFTLAMVLNERGRFFFESDQPDQAHEAFHEAHSLLTAVWKGHRFAFLERELGVSWNGRAGARIALYRRKPDAKTLELALADGTKALEYFEKTATTWPSNPIYQSDLGRTLANLARLALAQGDRKKAAGLFEQAMAHHQSATVANPESPEDPKLLDGLRAELKAIVTVGTEPDPHR